MHAVRLISPTGNRVSWTPLEFVSANASEVTTRYDLIYMRIVYAVTTICGHRYKTAWVQDDRHTTTMTACT